MLLVMQETVLRNPGDKEGTRHDASSTEKERTGTTASPQMLFLSPRQLCADASELRKRHGDRGDCFSAWETEREVHTFILGRAVHTNLLELDSSSSAQLPSLCCQFPRPHQEH